MMKALVIAMLLAGSAEAAPPAPRWTSVGPGSGGVVEVDRASLTWRRLQRAWWRVRFAEPRRDGSVEERNLELIDCHEGASAGIETVSLDAAGRVIDDQRDTEELAFQRMSPPTPDTPGEVAAMGACRLRPPPPPPPRRRR